MTMTAEQLAQLRDHIELRKAMPAFGPDTSIERLTILNATQCSFTPEIVEALLDELKDKDRRNAELNSTLERWAADRAQSASELDDAEKRIAELEARTVTVKLPHQFKTSMYGTPLYEQCDILAMLADAGINLTVEG